MRGLTFRKAARVAHIFSVCVGMTMAHCCHGPSGLRCKEVAFHGFLPVFLMPVVPRVLLWVACFLGMHE